MSHALQTEYSFPVPQHLFKAKGLHGKNQRVAIAYMYFRMSFNPQWKFHAVELASVLGITERGSRKLLMVFAKKGIVKDIGTKRIDIPANLQAHNLTHYFVHEFVGVGSVINAFMLPEQVSIAKTKAEKWEAFNRELDAIWAPFQVEWKAYKERLAAEFIKRGIDVKTISETHYRQCLTDFIPIIGEFPNDKPFKDKVRALAEKYYPHKEKHQERHPQ